MRFLLGALLLAPALVHADVVTRIIDTGPGLATVTRFDNGQIMVYDTGHWTHDDTVFTAIRDFIGDADIDLLIASHADSDHLAATDEIFAAYRVHRVIRTGFERPRSVGTWADHDDAIRDAAESGLTHDVSYRDVNLPHGTKYRFGNATVTVLAGFHEPPRSWSVPRSSSEFRNANSVVVRIDYNGQSILFTGDAHGRIEGTDADVPAIATERYLIDHRELRPIAADVLIAPHHGSDDASSTEFIRHVGARWVIFSAGHDNNHPNRDTARRYLSLGYEPDCLLRTDLGDHEPGHEWEFGRINGRTDPVRDDDIDIRLPATSDTPVVRYLTGTPVDCAVQNFAVAADEPSQIVKKSRSGICHTSISPYYDRLIHFEAMATLQECLDSGGREL